MSRHARPRVGALTILALCFALSAAFRIAAVGPATAQQISDADHAAGCGPDSDVLLSALRERGDQLDRREEEISERMAILALAEEEFTAKQAALVEAEERLASTLALADGAAERDLTQLTAIYENVKPKRAAEIFDSMDTNFATGILARMSPTAAAEIMTLMDAQKAYAISVLLAARNVNAGGVPPEN